MKIILTILTILFVILPLIGIVLLIRYVIKKSKADQPKHVLEKEKSVLIEKVRANKRKLIPWKPEYIEVLSNNIDFNYRKSFTRKFNGTIKTIDNKNLIAFRRLDRGQFKVTSRIFAIGSDFEIYFELKGNEIQIYFNNKSIGKLVNGIDIINSKARQIGIVSRNATDKPYYLINFNGEKIAYVIKNSDRRTFLRNPFYDFYPTSTMDRDPFIDNEVAKLTTLTKLYRDLNDEEYKWILSLIVFEAAYYGIDFLQ